MCVALPVIAGAAAAAGTLFNGYGAMQQGNYEADIARRNADMQVEAARDSIERGRDEARSLWRNIGAVKGAQTASMAANGLDLSFGAPVRMAEDTAMLAREDAENLSRNVNERTKGFDVNAANFVAEARAARQRGKAAMVGSVFEAGNSLMSGMQQQKLLRARLGVARPARAAR